MPTCLIIVYDIHIFSDLLRHSSALLSLYNCVYSKSRRIMSAMNREIKRFCSPQKTRPTTCCLLHLELSGTSNSQHGRGHTLEHPKIISWNVSWVFSKFFKQIQNHQKAPIGFKAFVFKWIPKILKKKNLGFLRICSYYSCTIYLII